jgi:hypothetical protein
MLQKIIVWTLVVVATFVAGHVSGRMLQHARTGYHYRVRNEKDIPFQSRSLSVRYVTGSVGLPFLDPGTTILALDDITIYKARRCFQEGFPVATDVSVNGDEISWNDGVNRYRLHVEPIPDATANRAPTVTDGANNVPRERTD